jgi:hypothetical protein
MPQLLRFTLPSLLILACVGCVDGSAPVDPPRSPPTPPLPPGPDAAWVWGHVLDDSGVCLYGAQVDIVAGPGAGRTATQTSECDAWSYVVGYEFKDLPMAAKIKLRASLAGYRSQERELVTQNGGLPIQFSLTKE